MPGETRRHREEPEGFNLRYKSEIDNAKAIPFYTSRGVRGDGQGPVRFSRGQDGLVGQRPGQHGLEFARQKRQKGKGGDPRGREEGRGGERGDQGSRPDLSLRSIWSLYIQSSPVPSIDLQYSSNHIFPSCLFNPLFTILSSMNDSQFGQIYAY